MQTILHSLFEANISTELLYELSHFIQRNSLVRGECCLRCFKAHALKLVKKEYGFFGIIDNLIPEEVGHHGYYLDGEEMKKV